MRIGIDARMMTPKQSRGIGRYIEELVRAMLVLAPENRYVLITRQPIHPFSSHPSVETVVADIPWYGWREQLQMPSVLKSLKTDVVHVPHWNVPLFYRGPLVVTLHDLLLRHLPRSARISTRNPFMAAIKRFGYRITLSLAVFKSKVILVPTRFVAEDVARFYLKAGKKIVVTGEGMIRHSLFPKDITERPPQMKYLLYVGSAYPHKGLDLLIDAWQEIEEQHPGLHLLIAGQEDEFMRRLQDLARRKKLARVRFLGFVKEEELSQLYRDALAFVFPSEFEGFGLPPLEALEAGCPVIASDAAALPEVLGPEGAIFFQSGSRTGILKAVERVLQSPESARRQAAAVLPELRERHDWVKAAEKTLRAYSSLRP